MPRPRKIPIVDKNFGDELLALIGDLKEATKDLAKRSKNDRYYVGMANGFSVVVERLELMLEKVKTEERAQLLQQELQNINQRLSESLKINIENEELPNIDNT